MSALGGPSAPKHTFLVFYSNVVNGKMWCPVSLQVVFPVCVAATMSSQSDSQDCVKVEDTVNKAFEGENQPSELYRLGKESEELSSYTEAVLYWVGERDECVCGPIVRQGKSL